MNNNKQPKWGIRSSVAFVICVCLLTGGFIFTGYRPAAQYVVYAGSLVVVLGAYIGKRLLQKKPGFNFGGNNEAKTS